MAIPSINDRPRGVAPRLMDAPRINPWKKYPISTGIGSAMLNPYTGTIGFAALAPLVFGEDPLTATTSAIGLTVAMGAGDIGARVAGRLRDAPYLPKPSNLIGRAGGRISPFLASAGKKLTSAKIANEYGWLAARSVGYPMRAAGGVAKYAGSISRGMSFGLSKAIAPLMVASVVGMFMPEGHPVRTASDYIMGIKSAEWLQEQIQVGLMEKRGGFGTNKYVNNERTIKSREIAKYLLGQSVSASLLGQEANYMHN